MTILRGGHILDLADGHPSGLLLRPVDHDALGGFAFRSGTKHLRYHRLPRDVTKKSCAQLQMEALEQPPKATRLDLSCVPPGTVGRRRILAGDFTRSH